MRLGARRRPSRRKLLVEALENRRVMATLQLQFYNDANINNTRDPGESLLAGQTINYFVDLDSNGTPTPGFDLIGSTNTGVATIVSPLLGAGAFNVFVDSTGSPFAGTAPQLANILDPLDVTIVPDIGVYRKGEVRGFKFNDHNADGLKQSTDEGLANFNFTLKNLGPDGIEGNSDDGPSVTLPTNATGNVVFPNLLKSKYQLIAPDDPNVFKSTTGAFNFEVNASGQVFSTAAGNFRWGEIRGYTFIDVNGNGVDNTDPKATTDVTLTLRGAGPDHIFGNSDDLPSVSKSPDPVTGQFAFPKLDFGKYQVIATLPSGVIRTTAALSILSINDSGLTYTPITRPELAIGLFRTAEIRVHKFNDRNADGLMQAGELGVRDVNFTLTKVGGTPTVVKTNANGDITFSGLTAGTYTLTEEVNPNVERTTGVFPVFEVKSGDVYLPVGTTAPLDGYQTAIPTLSLNRGDFRFGEIHGYVFVDKNGNAVDNNESRETSGITMNLRYAGPDGVFSTPVGNTDTPIIVDPTTGRFSAKQLKLGLYQLQETLTTNLARTTSVLGIYNVNDSGILYSATTTLVTRDDRQAVRVRPELALGVFRTGVIRGYAFGDKFGDGIDSGNEPIDTRRQVVVQLFKNGVFDKQTTATAAGVIRFDDLAVGTYRYVVSEIGADRKLTTIRVVDNLLIDSGKVFEAKAALETPLDGYQSSVVNSGLAVGTAKKAVIKGIVYLDRDGNGTRGAAAQEPGMAGFTVTLVGAGIDNIFGNTDDLTLTATTTSSGIYEFNVDARNPDPLLTATPDIVPGNFRIAITAQPAHYILSGQGLRPITGVRLNDILLGPGLTPTLTANLDQTQLTNANLNFGVQRLAAIQGIAFNDVNANGVKDPGEALLSGQTFQASNGSTTVTSLPTGVDGVYRFDDLPAGTYTVKPVLKTTLASGVTQETQGRTKNYPVIAASLNNIYVAPGLDPRLAFEKASSSTPPVNRILLNTTDTLEQGIVQLSKLEGNIFIDGNGARQAHTGVQVGIRRVVKEYQQDELPTERIVTTDSTGKYTFYVWPGNYDVAEVKLRSFEPSAVVSTNPNDSTADAPRQRFTDYGLINPNSGISTTAKISKPRWTTTADLDGVGGKNDVIVVYEYFNLADLSEGGGVTVYMNVGTANEKTIPIPLGVDTRPSFATVVQLDSGAPEILVALSGTPGADGTKAWGSVVVLTANAAVTDYTATDARTGAAPAGNVPVDRDVALSGDGPKHISWERVNGQLYLSVVNERTFAGSLTHDVGILKQVPGTKTFTRETWLDISTQFVSAGVITTAFANFDNQPGPEIAVAESSLGKVEFFTPKGAKKMSALTGLNSPTHVLAGDFVGADGLQDLVVSEYVVGQSVGRVSLYPQLNGTISPSSPILTPTSIRAGYLAADDINNDGLVDLAVASMDTGGVQFLYNRLAGVPTGNSTKFLITAPLTVVDAVPRPASIQQVAFGHFNNDNFLDFAATQFTGGVSLHTSAVTTSAHWKEQTTISESNKGIPLADKRRLAEQPISPTSTVFPLTVAFKNPNTAYPITSERPNTGKATVAEGFAVSTTFTTKKVYDSGNIRVSPSPMTLASGLAPALVAFDVSGNGQLDPLDALLVINSLNQATSGQVPEAEVDVNGDGVLSPVDALLIINQLNVDSAIGETIDVETAQAMYQAALTRLDAAPAIQSQLSQVTITMGDLPVGVLSWVDGNNLVVDRNAAGRGWFVDTTPTNDVEFATDGSVTGVDLLSVLAHEIGHLLGLQDIEGEQDAIMDGALRAGERRLDADAVDKMLASLL